MDYKELRKLKMELLQKSDKTDSEIQLLAELQSLSGIIDRIQHSLSLSTDCLLYTSHPAWCGAAGDEASRRFAAWAARTAAWS